MRLLIFCNQKKTKKTANFKALLVGKMCGLITNMVRWLENFVWNFLEKVMPKIMYSFQKSKKNINLNTKKK